MSERWFLALLIGGITFTVLTLKDAIMAGFHP